MSVHRDETYEPSIYGIEVYDYLVRLSAILKQRNAATLAEEVEFASHFTSGSMSELFGEAWRALHHVENRHDGVLESHEIEELTNVLRRINAEANRCNEGRGGLRPVDD